VLNAQKGKRTGKEVINGAGVGNNNLNRKLKC